MAGGGARSAPAGVGGTLFGGTGGRNAKQQNLVSPHSGAKATIMPGDPVHRMGGQYGKQPPSYLPATPTAAPAKAPKLTQVRGGSGGLRRNPRQGGIGPGPMSTVGSTDDYSMTSPDTE